LRNDRPIAEHDGGDLDDPLRRSSALSAAARMAPARRASHADGRPAMTCKILIVDDEPNIVLSLEYLMKRDGYEVLVAYDGQEALDVLRRERPRLVLLDVMMPKKSGFQVCQELRADDQIKDTLVLMLTAKGRETDIAKGLGVGANAYMTKPFPTRELRQKVAELLAGSQ
jgi:DNA-binding response OmpR family regulator